MQGRVVVHWSSLFHWLFRKRQRLLWVYGIGILMYEHVGEQVHVLHAVNGSHAPPVLTILHTYSYDEAEKENKLNVHQEFRRTVAHNA